jgi:hypothetical protein
VLFSYLLLHFLVYTIYVESSVNIRRLLFIVGPNIWSFEAADVAFLRLLEGTLAGAGSSELLLAALLPIPRKQKLIKFCCSSS